MTAKKKSDQISPHESVGREVCSMIPSWRNIMPCSVPEKIALAEDGRLWPVCEGFMHECRECSHEVTPVFCMTRYPKEDAIAAQSKDDPNRHPWLCPKCRGDYEDHWSEMWPDYYSGCL